MYRENIEIYWLFDFSRKCKIIEFVEFHIPLPSNHETVTSFEFAKHFRIREIIVGNISYACFVNRFFKVFQGIETVI